MSAPHTIFETKKIEKQGNEQKIIFMSNQDIENVDIATSYNEQKRKKSFDLWSAATSQFVELRIFVVLSLKPTSANVQRSLAFGGVARINVGALVNEQLYNLTNEEK